MARLLSLLLLLAFSAEGTSLRAILLCDTAKRELRIRKMVDYDRRAEARASYADALHVQAAISELSDELEFEAEVTVLIDEECSLHRLIDELESIEDEPDVLLFYYSGHGSHADRSEELWPVLEVGEHSVPLSLVAELLHRKKKRLAVVIADCCNHLPPNLEARGLPARRASRTEVTRNLSTLFTEPEGTLVVSGSSPGEQAFSREDVGGLFTTALLQTLEMEVTLGTEADWQEVLERTAMRLKQNYPLNPQTPIWKWFCL